VAFVAALSALTLDVSMRGGRVENIAAHLDDLVVNELPLGHQERKGLLAQSFDLV
jgi:hypothetical protein